jgi:anti-sigma-K factor RskA
MRYGNDRIRDALAAEYVLGTLRGPARRRFERSLEEAPRLRRAVAVWQDLLAPLNLSIEPVPPPARVWRHIQSRIEAPRRGRGPRLDFWASVGFWRASAVATSAVALLLAVWITLLPAPVWPQQTMVAVLSDAGSRPALVVSWGVGRRAAQQLRIRVMGHAEMAGDTAWELWMLPRSGGEPVSLGLITTHETQVITVPARLAEAVNAAWGLAMSVEPRGGSPTGLPTGAVLYKGPCTLL